jgi:hypothetical protein
MPLIPTGSETLARFVYFSKYIRSSNNTIRYAAFLPSPEDNQTSVFRVSELTETEIWNIADCDVTPKQTNTLKGRADIEAEDVRNSTLLLIPKEPPYRHSHLSGWPDDKSKHKLIAKELEKKANLHLVP